MQQAPNEFEAQARLLLAVKLCEIGRLTTGLAARLAGVPKVTFVCQTPGGCQTAGQRPDGEVWFSTELVWPGKYDEEGPDRESRIGVETISVNLSSEPRPRGGPRTGL
jgi:hypothetical protein